MVEGGGKAAVGPRRAVVAPGPRGARFRRRAPAALVLALALPTLAGDLVAAAGAARDAGSRLVDPCAERAMDALGLPRPARSAALRLRYLPLGDGREEAQNDVLGILGVDAETAGRLRAQGVLDIDPLERADLETLPPAGPANLRPGAVVSRPDPLGRLDNVLVEEVRGDGLVVRRFRDGVGEALPRRRASQPVAVGKRVVVEGDDGLPEPARVKAVIDGRLVRLDTTVERVMSMADLWLAPRARIATAGMRPIKDPFGAEGTEIFNDVLDRLHLLHKRGHRKKLIKLNNEFMENLVPMLADEGVVATLEPSFTMREAWTIRIHGVRPEGNRVAGLYARLSERLNSRSMTVSAVDNLKLKTEGFFAESIGRVDMGPTSVLSMMRGEKSAVVLHEFVHQMFDSNRNTGKFSFFDITFLDRDEKEHIAFLEEAYTHAAGAVRSARALRSDYVMNPIFHDVPDYVMKPHFAGVLNQIRHDIHQVETYADKAAKHLGRMLKKSMFDFNFEMDLETKIDWEGGYFFNLLIRDPRRKDEALMDGLRIPLSKDLYSLIETEKGEDELVDVIRRSLARVWYFSKRLHKKAAMVLGAVDDVEGIPSRREAKRILWKMHWLRMLTRDKHLVIAPPKGDVQSSSK